MLYFSTLEHFKIDNSIGIQSFSDTIFTTTTGSPIFIMACEACSCDIIRVGESRTSSGRIIIQEINEKNIVFLMNDIFDTLIIEKKYIDYIHVEPSSEYKNQKADKIIKRRKWSAVFYYSSVVFLTCLTGIIIRATGIVD